MPGDPVSVFEIVPSCAVLYRLAAYGAVARRLA